jgi:hypothetical protein
MGNCSTHETEKVLKICLENIFTQVVKNFAGKCRIRSVIIGCTRNQHRLLFCAHVELSLEFMFSN